MSLDEKIDQPDLQSLNPRFSLGFALRHHVCLPDEETGARGAEKELGQHHRDVHIVQRGEKDVRAATAHVTNQGGNRPHCRAPVEAADPDLLVVAFLVLLEPDSPIADGQDELDRNRQIAADAGIDAQVGLTQGGTDGTTFTIYGAPNAGLSWPGRYSHSPAEIADLRDIAGLVDLIQAMAEAPLDP